MIFNFLRPEQVLKAERTVKAGKIEKRSKAEEIFQPHSQATKGSETANERGAPPAEGGMKQV